MGYGGAPNAEFTLDIQNLMNFQATIAICENSDLEEDDSLNDYCQKLRTIIDREAFFDPPLKIAVDTMHGTTKGILKEVLRGSKSGVSEIHADLDPYFGGVAPELMESNTRKLQRLVSSGKCDLGIAHDGDGNRIVAIIPGAGYLSPHDVVVALLWYLERIRKQKPELLLEA